FLRFLSFYFLVRHSPLSTLFPYTTLFRSFFLFHIFILFYFHLTLGSYHINCLFFFYLLCFSLQYFHAVLIFISLLVLTISIVHLYRKSTRLNSSHGKISYAVFCFKK